MDKLAEEAQVVETPQTELINGEEVVSPSPHFPHQRLSKVLQHYLYLQEMEGQGELFSAPFDVTLEEDLHRFQPDLLFIKQGNPGELKGTFHGVPDLVVEIVSPASLSQDLRQKYAVYEKYGVPEYWLAYPELRRLEVFVLEEGAFRLAQEAVDEGQVASRVLEGFELDWAEVLRRAKLAPNA